MLSREICRSKDYRRRLAEGSGNVDAQGNFSIEVLRAALLNRYGLALPNLLQEGVADSMDVTEMEGFICNRSAHWFAIRKINGRYWNLNSTLERPQLISHFRLAAEIEGLQNEGYSVFCVPKGLPEPCTSMAQRSRGLPQYWWKESDLVKDVTNAKTMATDPWRNVGSGMRLDGNSTKKETAAPATNGDDHYMADLGGLTEEELMQYALEASLQQDDPKPSANGASKVGVPAEPSADASGAIKIQFRLPDGQRVVRRFLESDSVAIVYAYVEEGCQGNGRQLELRYGFPPKDLQERRNSTIAEAKLAGESITGRFV
jgi:ataxin-3